MLAVIFLNSDIYIYSIIYLEQYLYVQLLKESDWNYEEYSPEYLDT